MKQKLPDTTKQLIAKEIGVPVYETQPGKKGAQPLTKAAYIDKIRSANKNAYKVLKNVAKDLNLNSTSEEIKGIIRNKFLPEYKQYEQEKKRKEVENKLAKYREPTPVKAVTPQLILEEDETI